jgi:3-hydroxyisobutyrate dehydrogenase-like beta-hydroxyacid dehydrogenase
MRIGFIGFGEVGSEFAKGFAKQGVVDQVAYDAMREHPVFGPTIAARARDAAVRLVASPAELTAAADVLFLAVPCAVANAAVTPVLASLRAGTVLVDVTASSGEAKKRRAVPVEACGVAFVDAALMGPVSINGIRVPALVSGSGAPAFREKFQPLGMSLEVVSERAGDASAVKMVRSVFTKGMSALFLETFLAARRANVEELVFNSIVQSMEETPFAATINRYLCGVAIHAGRRVAEMHEVIDTLQELGIEPITADATRRRLERVAEAGLREHFKGVQPKRYAEMLEALDPTGARTEKLL